MRMTRTTALCIATASAAALCATATTTAEADADTSRARSGTYRGAVHDKGEQPSDKAWVRFKVGPSGRYVTKYRSRVWVTCWLGGTTYTSLPVKFKAPNAKINRKGKVDRRWKRKFKVDGESYKLKGRLKLNLRRPKHVRGHIRLEFADCWTGRDNKSGRIKAKRVGR